MPVKPLSPEDVNYNIPDFVIETVNQIIKNKYRGNEFTFKAKELIYLALSTGVSGSNKDWYAEKWMDFENIYREMGWDVEYVSPSYGENGFDPYYRFSPKV